MEKNINNRTKEWSRSSNFGGLCFIRKNGIDLCEINSDDADHIIEACNNYERVKEDNEALLENLKRIVDRIEENEMQNNFPSAYQRAKAAIEKSSKHTLVATK